MAATNQDLERAVQQGRFRQDLYYRLNVIPIVLPPLRDRRTDIPLLVEHFMAKYSERRPRAVSAEALKTLMAYDWPGNVRELESAIERALLLAEQDVILPEDLPASLRAGLTPRRSPTDLDIPDAGLDLEGLERSLIVKALRKAGGNVTQAARLLGLSRRTLQYRLEKIDPDRPEETAPNGAPAARKGAAGD